MEWLLEQFIYKRVDALKALSMQPSLAVTTMLIAFGGWVAHTLPSFAANAVDWCSNAVRTR